MASRLAVIKQSFMHNELFFLEKALRYSVDKLCEKKNGMTLLVDYKDDYNHKQSI